MTIFQYEMPALLCNVILIDVLKVNMKFYRPIFKNIYISIGIN